MHSKSKVCPFRTHTPWEIHWAFGFGFAAILCCGGVSNKCPYSGLLCRKDRSSPINKFAIKINWKTKRTPYVPIVMYPFCVISIWANISMLSSTLDAIVWLRILCKAFLDRFLGPLPQSSYIFDATCIRSMVGRFCLIKYNAHSKYSRKSMVPHPFCKKSKQI